MKTVSIIKLNAGNDNSGNPRRLWLGIAPCGSVSGVWDEGYEGRLALPKRLRHKDCIELSTTPREYRELLRLHKA